MLGFRALASSPLAVNHAFKRASGSLAATLDGISVTAAGQIGHAGTLSLTLADIAPSVTGAITRNGSITVALESVSVVMAGTDIHAGLIAVQLDDITGEFAGNVTKNGVLTVQTDDFTFAASGSDTHTGTLEVALDDLIIQFNSERNLAAGAYRNKNRKSYLINGKRMSLLPHELEAELSKFVEEQIEKPIPELVSEQAETTVFRIAPLGIEFGLILDEASKADVMAAMKRVEAERLGIWIEQQIKRHEEETVLMLLLAA